MHDKRAAVWIAVLSPGALLGRHSGWPHATVTAAIMTVKGLTNRQKGIRWDPGSGTFRGSGQRTGSPRILKPWR